MDPELRPATEGNSRIYRDERRLGCVAEGISLPTSRAREPKRHASSGPCRGVVPDGEGTRAATRELVEAAVKPLGVEDVQRGQRKGPSAHPCHSSPGVIKVTKAAREGGGGAGDACVKPGDVLQPAGPLSWEVPEEEPSLEPAGYADDSADDIGGSGESHKYYSADGSVSIADTEVVAEQMVTGTEITAAEEVACDDCGPLSHDDDEELPEAMQVSRGSDTEVIEEEAAGFPEDQGGGADVHGHDAVAEDVISKDRVGFISADDIGKTQHARYLGVDDGVHQRRQSGSPSLEIKKNMGEAECQGAGSWNDGADDTTDDVCSTEKVETAGSGTEEEEDDDDDDEADIEMEGEEEESASSEEDIDEDERTIDDE